MLLISFIIALIFVPYSLALPAIFVSGYSSTINAFSFNGQGTIQPLPSSTGPNAPSFLAFHPTLNIVYALDETTQGTVSSYSVISGTNLKFINKVSSGGQGPAYLSVHKNGLFVYVANYGNGNVGVINLYSNGSLGAVTSVTGGTNSHMAVTDPTGKYLFVPCKGADNVAQFIIQPNGNLVRNSPGSMTTPAGSGPRHIEFHPTKNNVYLINELSSTLMTLSYNPSTGTMSILQTLSSVPSTFKGYNTGAEVHVSPNGQFVYVSNRGHNSIGIFSVQTDGTLQSVGWETGGGSINTPRDFTIDPTGKFIWVTNQGANSLTGFSINLSGTLTKLYNTALNINQPSFVGVWNTRVNGDNNGLETTSRSTQIQTPSSAQTTRIPIVSSSVGTRVNSGKTSVRDETSKPSTTQREIGSSIDNESTTTQEMENTVQETINTSSQLSFVATLIFVFVLFQC